MYWQYTVLLSSHREKDVGTSRFLVELNQSFLGTISYLVTAELDQRKFFRFSFSNNTT